MALFNKLFSSKRRNYKHQDNVREKLFQFNNDQVRVVLYRECDFRGRKLLFDSHAVEKVPVVKQCGRSEAVTSSNEKKKATYAEVSNGHGYMYTKPNSDVQQLGEMIFGSVAMSYRGTSYKMHSLASPASLMCTQVFPCPTLPNGGARGARNSAPGRTCLPNGNTSSLSLDHSSKLEDSSTSCTTSFSDHSVQSTASDTLLVCRRDRSLPLDVPNANNIPNSTLVRDSGFCGDNSYSSTFSGSKSIPMWETSKIDGNVSFSCGSLYKRWLRSTSTSLDYSTNSLSGSEDCKPQQRTKKLGLAIIIQLGENQEERLEQYLLEHAVLIEAMVWRLRHSAEVAYIRHTNFLSLMFEVTTTTCNWLTSFLSGPQLSSHTWQVLSSNCDNCLSINASSKVERQTNDELSNDFVDGSIFSVETLKWDTCECAREDYAFLNISRFFRGECESKKSDCVSGRTRRELAQKFVRELCELLDTVDIKHTNFFVSTLVTAVLTHHLGWVATAWNPTESDKEIFRKLEEAGNPLWGQLSDLYGAVGYPTKMAHTMITGSNNSELISKLLNSLTYFIRCNDVVRKSATRADIQAENLEADRICRENKCIPKENYKKYEDHLKELTTNASVVKSFQNNRPVHLDFNLKTNDTRYDTLRDMEERGSRLKNLKKSSSYLSNLSKLCEDSISCKVDSEQENISYSSELINSRTEFSEKDDVSKTLKAEYPKKHLRRMRKSVVSLQNLRQLNVEEEFQMNPTTFHASLNDVETENNNVVFVLGDDDQLIGLRNNTNANHTEKRIQRKNSPPPINHVASSVKSKETIPKLSRQMSCENVQFNDTDFIELKHNCNLKPSTSWSQLNGVTESPDEPCSSSHVNKDFSRARSVPPEEIKPANDVSAKPRFHYTGVKFNFKKHPQIFTNYMRSKNIELSNLNFSEKVMKFNGALATNFDFSTCREETTEVETLQTPSNASELEFISEIHEIDKVEVHHAKEEVENIQKTFIRTTLPNTIIKEPEFIEFNKTKVNLTTTTAEGACSIEGEDNTIGLMKVIELPMPKSVITTSLVAVGYTSSLFRGVNDKYMSDMVLQGISTSKNCWETALRKDLSLAARHPLLDQPVEEAVAIIANTDTWEVQLMSSHTYVIDKGTSGVRIGMSQLVANMLEQLQRMWKLRAPPEHCLMHIEERLQEFCQRSKALAEMLLETDFCSMELLTSTLQLEINDIPLLMAVASTHSPQITQKYGLSFQ